MPDLSTTDVEGMGAVLFPTRAADDPELVAWSAANGGTLEDRLEAGSLWTPPGPATPTRLEPVADERFVKSMERIEVDVTGRDGFLLLGEPVTLHAGWTATINGEETELLRADGLATLVRIEPGARRLQLAYATPGLVRGAWVSASTLVAVLAIIAWCGLRTTSSSTEDRSP